MAKRTPIGEKPYRPVDEALIRSVMGGSSAVGGDNDGNAAVALLSPPATAPAIRVTSPTMNTDSIPPRVIPAGPRDSAGSAEQAAVDSGEFVEPRQREKRVLLTRSEERDIERMVARLATELGTPMKLSHLLRAGIVMLLHAEGEVMERAKRVKLTRPGNGNGPELAQFEHGVAQLLSAAFREAIPLR